MDANQDSNPSQISESTSSSKSTNILSLTFIIGFVALIIGIVGGYFLTSNGGKIVSMLNNSSVQVTPTATPPKEEILYKSDWATISWKNINYSKHSADLYFSYIDTSGSHSQVFMRQVSLENEPLNVLYNGNRFIFELSGPGDGFAYFLSNARPPFNVKALKLPANWDLQTYSNVIGWIDDKTILYKKLTGFDPKNQTITYWVAPADNVENAIQTSLK